MTATGRWSWLTGGWSAALLVALLAFSLGRCLPRGDAAITPGDDQDEADADLWTCSMHPQVRQEAPGVCPLCGMELIPATSVPEAAASEAVELSPRAATLAQLRTAAVERMAAPGVDLRLLGRVELDENRVRNVSAWIPGRIDTLLVRETGASLRRGQTVAKLYSPEVYAAHQDLITARRQAERSAGASELAAQSAAKLLEAAQERLRLLGIGDDELEAMARARRPRTSIPVRSRYAGTVIERRVTEGEYVETGAVLYRVADLSRLWVLLEVYEPELPLIVAGQSVDIEVAALPGETFAGEVTFIEPVVDAQRRVAQARVEVHSHAGKLRPGMFVEARVRGASSGEAGTQRPLTVPASAPLFTGQRSLVYVEVSGGERPRYEPRSVELGPRMGERYPVVTGLDEGERVVVHGAFTLDADLQIRGGPSMMSRREAEPDRALVAAPLELSAGLRDQLVPVVAGYLALQQALAGDDWPAAQVAAEQLERAVAAVRPGQGDPGAEAWRELGPELLAGAEAARQAAAIEGARGAFLRLSGQLARLLATFGNPTDEVLRLAHCPMADGDRGASWFQREATVENSYFGAAMLRCGELRATVEPGAHLLAGPDSGSARGHRH